MAVFPNLELGKGYDKKSLSKLINEPKAAGIQSGLLYCDNSDSTFLFVTLDKHKRDKDHKYNDYFIGENFEWDSQNGQNFDSDRIQQICDSRVQVHLLARVKEKEKNGTAPFIYCGQLSFLDYDKTTSNPVHITFRCEDYMATPSEKLAELYDWKPGDVGRLSSIRGNYRRAISSVRKKTYQRPNKTERSGLVTSRIGQGYFRDQVLEKWGFKCAVCSAGPSKILIASHIVPWKDSKKSERLDPENGILLSPNYDALFDKHLISFELNGNIVISKKLSSEDLIKLGIDIQAEIKVNEEMKKYLKRHRSQLK